MIDGIKKILIHTKRNGPMFLGIAFPFFFDFSKKNAKRIIENTSKEVANYLEKYGKKVELTYMFEDNSVKGYGGIEMKTTDKSIYGYFKHGYGSPLPLGPVIEAKLFFNSDNPQDKEEFMGLLEIIKKM